MSRTFDLGLFTAQRRVEQARIEWSPTTRLPGNVPYLVDNLWEWRRCRQFSRYPTRRHAVFAYSQRGLAEQYVAENPDKSVQVYRIILHDRFRLCQVSGLRDSKFHPDCKGLRPEVLRILGERGLVKDNGWSVSATLPDKQLSGSLWIPGLTAENIQALSQASEVVRDLLEFVEPKITYWKDFLFVDENTPDLGDGEFSPFDDSELFVEPTGGYELVSV